MKNIFSLVLFVCMGHQALAQADSNSVYLRFPTVPPFSITKLPDSTRFTKEDLHPRKATLFIIFNPFCDHCKHGLEDLEANIELYKDAQIVMASPIEYPYLKKFYEEEKVADYPNIIMGRDPSNYFGTFFNVQSIPAIFGYDKKGRFVKRFGSANNFREIAAILKL